MYDYDASKRPANRPVRGMTARDDYQHEQAKERKLREAVAKLPPRAQARAFTRQPFMFTPPADPMGDVVRRLMIGGDDGTPMVDRKPIPIAKKRPQPPTEGLVKHNQSREQFFAQRDLEDVAALLDGNLLGLTGVELTRRFGWTTNRAGKAIREAKRQLAEKIKAAPTNLPY